MRRRIDALLLPAALLLSGCLHSAAGAGRDADASVSGLRAELGEINAALVQMRRDWRAGRDIRSNDDWTMRLLGAGVLILGLSYPVGKIVWMATGAIKDRAMRCALNPRPTLGRWVALFRRHL